MAYDYNTGKLLEPGQQQSQYNMYTGQRIGSPPTSTGKKGKNTGRVKAGDIGNVEPYIIPAPSTTPATGNLAQATNAVYSKVSASANDQAANNKQNLQSMLEQYMEKTSNYASDVNAINAQEKIAEKRQAKKALEREVQQFDADFREKIKTIRENKGGMWGNSVEQNVAREQEKYDYQRANKMFAYTLANDDYVEASTIANEKINALRDQNTQALQSWQLWKDMVYNDMTESEKLQAQSVEAQKKSDYEIFTNTYSDAIQAGLDNKAGQAYFNALDTAKENGDMSSLTSVMSQYGYRTLDQQNTASLIADRYSSGSGGGGGGGSTSIDPYGQYSNDLDAIIGSVVSTIPSKFGQQTFNTQIGKARNDADKISLVAAQVLKGQPAEFKNDFRNQAIGISQIDKAIAEIDSGVKTGAIQNAAQYTFNLFGKDYDPKLAKISGYITSAIQPYRNSVTGAAWGDQEEAEYASLFGSTKYSPQELKQRLTQTKELLKSKSAEGLNAFVNPLGVYDNQFNTGSLAPSNTNAGAEGIFDSVVGSGKPQSSSWIKNLWSKLF